MIQWDCCFLHGTIDDHWPWTHFKDLMFGAADRSIPKVMLGHHKRSSWLSEETLLLVHNKAKFMDTLAGHKY